jgi:hypothetical protein
LLVATIYSTPSIAASLFVDGFESGDLSTWTASSNFIVQSTSIHAGSWAGEAQSAAGASNATAAFSSQSELWSTAWFKVNARNGPVWLTSFRNGRGGALELTGLNRRGAFIVRYTATKTTYTSAIKLTDADWHQISVHLKTGSGGAFDVALDGVPLGALSASSDAGRRPIAQVKIGDTYARHSYDVAFDEVSVATEGPTDTTDPTQPAGLAASLEGELFVSLTWEPSTDDIRVTGYTILRSIDGTNYSEAGSSTTTSFTDSQLQPETTYWWTVEAFDAAGNRSVPSDPTTATTGSDPAASIGRWSQPFDLGVVGMHAALLYTGKVLLYWGADASQGSTAAKIWDPGTGVIEDVRVPDGFDHNLFCSSLALRSDGGVFVTGGTLWGATDGTPDGTDQTAFFDPITEGWQVGPQMALRRWYDTTVELPDGDALVFSGQVFPGEQATEVEHYDAASDVIWTLPSSATLTMQNYPRMFLMGDGRIARVGREAQTMFFDPASNAWSTGPSMLAGDRARGSAVLMPDGHTVLAVGGAVNDVTTNTAELVDLAASQPSWSYTGSMNEPRRSLNAVLLPDGKVLAIGGNRGTHNYDDPVFNSEMYDPATGIWTLGPSQAAPRAYHSTALLLPDGRVLSAGQTDGPMQTTAEIYSPPYLFAGPRPVITSAPTNVAYGSAFTVGTDRAGDVGDVVLIRPGAVTHGVSFDQRSVPLPFTAQEGSLSVDTPTSTQAPPGWYMLFLVDNTGVPSVANWVHLPEA